MAHNKSAIKKIRRDQKLRIKNRRNMSRLRTQIKKFRGLLAANDIEALNKELEPTLSLIDKSVQKNMVHKNKASRLKSRLQKHYNAALNKESSDTDS